MGRVASLAAHATVAVRVVLLMEKAMVERLGDGAKIAGRLAVTASIRRTRLANNGRITTMLADTNRTTVGDERRGRSRDVGRNGAMSVDNILRAYRLRWISLREVRPEKVSLITARLAAGVAIARTGIRI